MSPENQFDQKARGRESSSSLQNRVKEAYGNRYRFQEETEQAYGKELYDVFKRRYATYADLTDVAERLGSEQRGSEWRGAPPKEGTYSLDIASELYQASLRRMEDTERILEYMYNKESFNSFVRVLSPYPEIRQDVRRFKNYIEREEGKGSQTPPQQ